MSSFFWTTTVDQDKESIYFYGYLVSLKAPHSTWVSYYRLSEISTSLK
jgi:hypothetical protein